MTGLPYEECRRSWEEGRALPGDGPAVTPAYALPPFHPGHPPRSRHRRGRRAVDGALVSGVLGVLCVATLIVTVVVAATLPV
ncbi:hypothetical protein [Streptomyces sp. MMG1121]|uniref:hypothetical protein n=1 Tax=Streptomyces sp. MMG1121 TaxID=1415544 RepID=UPI0006AE6F32|nr:hypothetical protein [Streptomyces sp. MMG1121]KOV66375.1 hypothetical protein ADK64_12685 [Streptomyces sp. MMG1121]